MSNRLDQDSRGLDLGTCGLECPFRVISRDNSPFNFLNFNQSPKPVRLSRVKFC